MRRVLGALLACVLFAAAAACSSDDSSAGSVEAFCARAEQLSEMESDSDEISEEELAEFQAWVADAPEEIRADLEKLVEVIERLAAFDEDAAPDEAFGEVFALLFDPTFLAAAERIETFLVEECGIEDAGFGLGDDASDGFDDGFDFSSEFDMGSGDDSFGSGDMDDDEGIPTLGVRRSEVEVELDRLFPDQVSTARSSSGNGVTTLDVEVESMTVDEAVAGCEELSEFLADHPDASGTATFTVRAGASDGEELVVNDQLAPGDPGSCEPV